MWRSLVTSVSRTVTSLDESFFVAKLVLFVQYKNPILCISIMFFANMWTVMPVLLIRHTRTTRCANCNQYVFYSFQFLILSGCVGFIRVSDLTNQSKYDV